MNILQKSSTFSIFIMRLFAKTTAAIQRQPITRPISIPIKAIREASRIVL